MTKKPLFVSMPRSGSTILFELGKEYAVRNLGMKDLGKHSEIFSRYTHNMVAKDVYTDLQHSMELFLVNDKDPHYPANIHYVTPSFFASDREAIIHKIKVFMLEQDRGFEHYIKIMANSFVEAPEELMGLYKNRKFILTRSRNLRKSALSLVYSRTTGLWHYRNSNSEEWNSYKEDPIYINPGMVEVIWPDIKVYKNMDNWENKLSIRGADYMVIYKEDIENEDSLYGEVDKIFETRDWRETLTEDWAENLPQRIEKDYSKLIQNYDQIASLIDERLKQDFIT